MEKQKLIYVESKALFSPSEVSDKAIVFIKDTKEIWTHGTYFICSNVWATPITLTLSGDSTGSVSIDGSGNVTLLVTNQYLDVGHGGNDANFTVSSTHKIRALSEFSPSFSNGFPATNYANAIININTHSQNYDHQLGFSSNKGIYHRTRNAGTWETSWREILTSTNYTKYPHTFASLTNKPTTISGYGITDSVPIIKGGEVTGNTDLSTLGMATTGYKFSISYGYTSQPSWLTAYTNLFIFRASSDFYSGIATALSAGYVTFLGGRNAETAPNNVPNWWFRIYGTSGQVYNLANIQTAINNLGSTYLPLTGGTLTDTLILKAGAFTASNSNSYSGGRYQAVSKPNIRLVGDSTYGLSTIEFTSLKGDTSINKPSDSGFIQFQPYGVSALSSVGSHPTLKTSGESNALVLGVTNDSDDIIVLLSPNISGLRHACGATEYYLPHITTSTTTANKPLVSTTTAHVYTLGDEYLPLKGGTMTGKITLWAANADAANTGGLNANNSNIYGLNSLYFADASETAAEGINFYRSSTTVDSLWGSNGNLYWTPNRTYGLTGTNYYVLTSNNYSTHLNKTYLPLSGGIMTGLILMTRGSSYLTDTGSGYSMLGMINSGNATIGMNSEEGMFINVPFTLATLRTSGNNLWHYNHANSARYLILDANNYTNYTIPYAKANSVTGVLPIISNLKLYHNDDIKFLYFTTSDNGGAISYLLIAELTNYGTGTNTSYVNYGLVGTIYGYRGGNMANTHVYNVSVGASIGSITFTRVYTSAITDALVPMIVKYDGKYYIALLKSGSSTGHYFIGLAINLLSSYITVNDSSLVEIIIKPSGEVSTDIKYYNGGDPKYYLHEGNYSNYALPLSGGTLTGTLTSSNIVPRTSVTYDIGTTSAYYNHIYALYFKRKDSSDSYVLLGGGGHKAISDFVLTSSLNNYVTLSTDLTISGKKLFNNQLIIRKDVGDTDSKVIDIQHDLQLQVRRNSNTHSVAIGVMPTGAGVIWAKANGIGYNTLYLNPYNNGVAIGCGGNGALPNLNDGHYFHIFGSTLSNNSITATKFIKSGGTASQFLKADGSLDSTSYLKVNGTNGTTDGVSTLLNKLTTGTATPVDADYYICQYAGGGTTTTSYVRRPISALYTYIKSKLSLNPDERFIYATSATSNQYGTTEATGSSSTLTRTLFWRDNDRALIGMYVQHSDNLNYGFELASSYGPSGSLTYRRKYSGTWEIPQVVLTKSNYNNYSPTLTGTGASGTWGINISGTANKVANALTLLLNGGTTSGTNKFVYDGSAAYTVNITPAAIGAAASSHNHDDAYLKLSGGTLGSSSASSTELRTLSSTAALQIMSYSDSTNYILSGNSSFDGNATLKITGYSNVTGTNLYFKFNNIYCRGNDYINIDSGNYGSYALPLSGGTMTGAINTANIYPKANAGFNIGSTSSYYNTMYAYYFKKYGSDDNYLLLGGGGHKKISDFPLILDKGIEGGNGGNTDNWVLVLNNNYSTGWYGPCTMFYIRSKNFGCGILCFYHYWNTEGTSGYYDNSVWFFGAEHSAYSGTMGGIGRDINNYLKVYIDKLNADLKIYYNRYNNLALNVQELLFVHGPSGTLYPSGELRASHFINSTLAVALPTTSNTFVNLPILTVKNHTEDIKTTRSVYASAFYENSDIRLKENIHSIDLIDLLKNVDLVQFNFKNDLNKKYGVIAQQLEQVGLNNLVYEHNGNKAVDYISLLVLETLRLRNEIKELKEKLDKKELSS